MAWAFGREEMRKSACLLPKDTRSDNQTRYINLLFPLLSGETTEDGRFTLEYCPCLGLCEISPAIMINEHVYGNLTPESVRDIIKQYIREDVE